MGYSGFEWGDYVSVAERRPAHGAMRITGLDGNRHTVETTALPLQP